MPVPSLHELLAAHSSGGAEQSVGLRGRDETPNRSNIIWLDLPEPSVENGGPESDCRKTSADVTDRNPAGTAVLPEEFRKIHETVSASYALLADIGACMQKHHEEIRTHVRSHSFATDEARTRTTSYENMFAEIHTNQNVQQVRLDQILVRLDQYDEGGREDAERINQGIESLRTLISESAADMKVNLNEVQSHAPASQVSGSFSEKEEEHPRLAKQREAEDRKTAARVDQQMRSIVLAENKDKLQRHVGKVSVSASHGLIAMIMEKIRSSDMLQRIPCVRPIIEFLIGSSTDSDAERKQKEADKAERRNASICVRIVEGPLSSVAMAAILLNVLWMGVLTDLRMSRFRAGKDTAVDWHDHVDFTFLLLFSVEILWRMAVHRLEFFVGADWKLNFFDFCVVLVSWPKFIGFNVGVMSEIFGLLRLARVLRLLKIIRQFRAFTEFRILLLTIGRSAKVMFWCIAIFFFWTFIIAVAMMQVFIDGADQQKDKDLALLSRYFSSVKLTMLTLVEAATTGVLWGDVGREMQQVNAIPRVLLYAYVLPVIFCLFPVIAGLYAMEVNDCLQSDTSVAMNRRHAVAKEFCTDLRNHLFDAGFTLQSHLNKDELEILMHNHELELFLDTHGIHSSARELIDLFDVDLDETLTVGEFMEGCQWLKMCGGSTDLLFMGEQISNLHNLMIASNLRSETQREELREVLTRMESFMQHKLSRSSRMDTPIHRNSFVAVVPPSC